MEHTWEGNAGPGPVAPSAAAVAAIVAMVCALSTALAGESSPGDDNTVPARRNSAMADPHASGRPDLFPSEGDGGLVGKRVAVYAPKTNSPRLEPKGPWSYSPLVARRGGNPAGFFCTFFFIGMIVVVMVCVAAANQRQRTAEAYSRLAARYGGTCDPGGWMRCPTVRFLHAGVWVVVDVYSTGGKHPTHYTQVHIHGRPTNVRCEVYPEGVWSRLGKLVGFCDIEIGSPDFDDRYIITGDDPAALRGLLTTQVQYQIERLRLFLGNDNIYISFNRRELLIKKLSFIRDYRTLVRFTELATRLYDLVGPGDEGGIEFVGDATPPDVTEAVCQICGETIQTDFVSCRRCKTPHHHDCWDYYGACSTYGCGERRFVRKR